MILRTKGPFSNAGSALFFRTCRLFRKDIKKIKPEGYVQFTEIKGGEIVEKKETSVQELFPVRVITGKDSKEFIPRGFNLKDETDRPQPASPSLSPYTIKKPELFTKRYKWCSCGMSSKQVV